MSPDPTRLPGRLGDPASSLQSDPRSDPRMIAGLAPFGLDAPTAIPPVKPTDTIEAQQEFCVAAEAGFEQLFDALLAPLDPVPGVTRTVHTVTGVDGNEIAVYVHAPTERSGPLPGVVHTHGGGMALLHASASVFVRWRDELAARGMVVVAAEFRNAGGGLGVHPFPAPLNDCVSVLKWVGENRATLGIGKIVLQGESGGANLAIAQALWAKREGRPDLVDGVYASIPYISGGYEWDEAERSPDLPSLVEANGYFIGNELTSVLRFMYDRGVERDNPLAWPGRATVEELAGLPPHMIVVNELDPLRDEGIAYHRRLLAAGVPSVGRVNLGLCHFAIEMMPVQLPGHYRSMLDDIRSFAVSL